MSTIDKDPTAELYAILDKSGLTSAQLLQGNVPMALLVTKVRVHLVKEIKAYIERRENNA